MHIQSTGAPSYLAAASIFVGSLLLGACSANVRGPAVAGATGAGGTGSTTATMNIGAGSGGNGAGAKIPPTAPTDGGASATPAPPPARCPTVQEAEAMQASTGEAVDGGWNLYSNGTLTATHAFTGGATNLTVTARGSVAGGVWPHMVVRVGTDTIGEVDVTSLTWATYPLSGNVAAGSQPLEIAFTNDGANGPEDRNLYVDKVEIDELCTAGGASPNGGGGGNGAGLGTMQPLDATNPFSTPLYVEGGSLAASAEGALRGAGSSGASDADLLHKISSAPQATWIGNWSGDPAGAVAGALDEAGTSLRVLVAYNIYNRDCGNQSAGGAADAPSYKSWIDGFANGIGDRKAVVILEPDTLAYDCDPTRWDVLSYAVTSLKKKINAHVYIDAGHAGWVDAGTMAARLKTAGIANADGFSLNVANFETTDASVAYGTTISGSVGGKPFVIDTSRNGKGSPGSDWCNPPGRGLGERPTGTTSRPLVHAFLWIKRPGESDGVCNGGPPAGQWFQAYALDLARNAIF